MSSNEYIKTCVVKCRARSTLYHTASVKWSRIHWATGVINGLIAASISVLSFLAQRNEWSNTEIGMLGGLILSVSTSLITSLKPGQNQKINEEAGDAYRNLESKILAKYNPAATAEVLDELKELYRAKLEKLTNKYAEPEPQKCIDLERTLRPELWPAQEA